jgi:hypothetical protein
VFHAVLMLAMQIVVSGWSATPLPNGASFCALGASNATGLHALCRIMRFAGKQAKAALLVQRTGDQHVGTAGRKVGHI